MIDDETDKLWTGIAVGTALSAYLWALGALTFLLTRSALDLALAP